VTVSESDSVSSVLVVASLLAMSSSAPSFPWQHSFPPFYTLQPHKETRQKQLETWRAIVLDYCQAKNVSTVDVAQLIKSDLFHNKAIKRQLTGEALDAVLDDLRSRGHLEWLDKGRKRCRIFWRTPEEWGELIYFWARENGLTNTVCTLYEITDGEDAAGKPFDNLEKETVLAALKTLQAKKKAEIFDGDEGVKFF